MTNRKSHTRFPLAPKPTTLDDLERPLRTLLQNACVFGAHHESFNEDRPTLHYQRQRCSPMTPVSGNVRFMRIFAGFPGQGASNDSQVLKTAISSTFARYFFRIFRDKANVIVYYYLVPRRLSNDPIIHDLE